VRHGSRIFGFFNLSLLIGWRTWRASPEFLRRAAWVIPIIFVIQYSVGYIREVRYFLAVLPVVVPLTLIALQRRSEGPSALEH
jgi:hypothetical protein